MTTDIVMAILSTTALYYFISAARDLWRNHCDRLDEFEFSEERTHITNVHYGVVDWAKLEDWA
jgi:hypothetical protein